MSKIVLSAGVRQNLLSLQNTAQMMATTQQRLATGKKVNTALDNPTNFFTSAALQSRAGDLNSLLDSMSVGIKTLEAADNGIKAITRTVETMQSALRQARQDKSFKTESFPLDATAIGTDTLKSLAFSGGAVGATPVMIALNAPSMGVLPTQGSVTTAAGSYTAPLAVQQASVTGANGSYTPPLAAQQASVTAQAGSYTPPLAGTQSTVTAANIFTDIDLSNDVDNTFTFDVTLGAETVNITLTGADGTAGVIDIDQAILAIQTQLDAHNLGAGLGVTVGKEEVTPGNWHLTFTADAAGDTALTIDNGATAGTGNLAAVADLGITDLATTGQTDTGDPVVNRVIEVNGEQITLTAANAADAVAAAATIQAALTLANIDLTVTGNNVDGNITIEGPADGSLDITIAGADADDVFGTAGSRTVVTAQEQEDRVVTINGEQVTLTAANGATASQAAATIQAALTLANIDLTVTGDDGDGFLSVAGPADGSLDITIAGADADDVFGTAGTRTVVTAQEQQDRVITVNGEQITLTAANGATAIQAAATIQAALDNANIAVTVTGNANGSFVLTGPADGTLDVAIAGADADDVFGTAGTRTVVAADAGQPNTPNSVKSVDALVAEINSHADLRGRVRASNDNGRLRIENQSTGDLEVEGLTNGTVTGGIGTLTIGGNEVRRNLVNQFNDLRDQLDKLADDASFNGINLLRGDKLKITFNETGTSTIEIQAKDLDGNETAVNSAMLEIYSLLNSQVDSDDSIDGLLLDLSDALATIRSHASNFGSNLSIVENRTEFTKAMINTLQTGADNLVLADVNEEAANMLALQTRQQLSSTALSLASQADQAVLRLFG